MEQSRRNVIASVVTLSEAKGLDIRDSSPTVQNDKSDEAILRGNRASPGPGAYRGSPVWGGR